MSEKQFSGSVKLSDGSRRALTSDEAEALWRNVEAADADRKARIPDQSTALNLMMDAFTRLKDMGWREAIYCPKDGSEFEVIEAGSTGIHRCIYQGKWPDGGWWILDDGDIWPSRPMLFREVEHAPLPQQGGKE